MQSRRCRASFLRTLSPGHTGAFFLGRSDFDPAAIQTIQTRWGATSGRYEGHLSWSHQNWDHNRTGDLEMTATKLFAANTAALIVASI